MTDDACLVAVGGAHIDRRGQVAGSYVPAASNPGTMHEDVGGGAFNAARMAVRRGLRGCMLSLRGGDAAGAAVAEAIAAAGLDDLSAVFLDRTTPSYTALLEANGDLVAGLADMDLYEIAFEKQMRRRRLRDALDTADAVLTDANLPAAALKRLVSEAARRQRPVFAIGVSPAKVVRFASILPQLRCLFMNRREAEVLCGEPAEDAPGLAAALRARGLSSGVVTTGAEAVLVFDRNETLLISPPRLDAVADVTGAGDALAGAAIAASMKGASLAEAARQGIAAAVLAVGSRDASPRFADEDFDAALALVGTPRSVA